MHQDESTHSDSFHRRSTDHGDTVEARLHRGDARMNKIESDLSEILEIVRMGKSFFKVLGYVGTFIKWAVGIATPVIAIYAAWKHGGQP